MWLARGSTCGLSNWIGSRAQAVGSTVERPPGVSALSKCGFEYRDDSRHTEHQKVLRADDGSINQQRSPRTAKRSAIRIGYYEWPLVSSGHSERNEQNGRECKRGHDVDSWTRHHSLVVGDRAVHVQIAGPAKERVPIMRKVGAVQPQSGALRQQVESQRRSLAQSLDNAASDRRQSHRAAQAILLSVAATALCSKLSQWSRAL